MRGGAYDEGVFHPLDTLRAGLVSPIMREETGGGAQGTALVSEDRSLAELPGTRSHLPLAT